MKSKLFKILGVVAVVAMIAAALVAPIAALAGVNLADSRLVIDQHCKYRIPLPLLLALTQPVTLLLLFYL